MNDWKFLVFDHKGKRPDSHKGKSGIGMARKLQKENFKGIQVLCHNCNTGKEIYGTKRCPHHLSKKGKFSFVALGVNFIGACLHFFLSRDFSCKRDSPSFEDGKKEQLL